MFRNTLIFEYILGSTNEGGVKHDPQVSGLSNMVIICVLY